jgi:hypothetical protein
MTIALDYNYYNYNLLENRKYYREFSVPWPNHLATYVKQIILNDY